MENQRIIALGIAMLAAMLVILAGKSCASSINNANKKSTEANPGYSHNFTDGAAQNSAAPDDNSPSDIQTVPHQNEPSIEYITDILGRVIGTKEAEYVEPVTEPTTRIEYVTDILGRVLGTEVVTEEWAADWSEPVTEPTSKKNPLEQYWEDHPTEARTEEESESGSYTIPDEIHITIG